MRIRYQTNHMGEDIFVPFDKLHNRFFEVKKYGITNPCSSYGLFTSSHRYHVFEYVISGKGYIDCALRTEHITVTAGDFYYLRRGFVGHYYADADEPYKKIWVNTHGTMIDDLLSTFNIDAPVLVCHNGAPMEAVIRRIHRRLDECEGKIYSEVMQSISVDVFELLSLAKATDVIADNVFSLSLMDEIKQYIRSCVLNELDLSALAEHFHLNPSYLIRKFKKTFGMTPMRYFGKCRIEAARNMLIFPPKTIKHVAEALGYSDAAYFSNCFKAETGYAPSEYTPEIHAAYLAKK